MRTFLPKRDDERESALIKQLRTDRPLLPYARRSDPIAKDEKKDKSQSREMQTEDMIKWGKMKGWVESLIYPYFADLGLSGTLRPDQRPDMLRLFDDLDSGKLDHSTLACWQENRLFRDETHIYYNQLIDKMLQHDVVLVVLSPRLYIYDMRDEYDKERLCDKLKEAAEFIPHHVKGFLHPARERATWEDDEWAGMGDPPPGFVVDLDPKSPTYKHLIPYWPHIEKVREYFLLYMEMGGEIGLVNQRLRAWPIVFPEFGPEVDRVNVNKLKLSRYPGSGYYIKSKYGVVSLLTNPIYIGYRSVNGVIRRDDQGNKLLSHEPVIERELFDFAYYRLAKTDLDGHPLEGGRRRRYFYRKNDGEFGLLKCRIKSDQGEVHAHSDGHGTREGGVYRIQVLEESFLRHYMYQAEIACEELDTIVVNRLLEHVDELSQKQESIQLYEERATALQNVRLAKISQVEASIKDIDKSQSGLTRNLGKVEIEIEEAEEEKDEVKKELKEKRKQLIEQEIETLEAERIKLIRAKKALGEEADSDIGTLEEELLKLKKGWPKYFFKKRRSLINFALQEVRIEVVSTHWMRVEISWLHEDWGREEIYYRRGRGARKEWTEEELAIIQEHYETMPRLQLMGLLPNRSWEAIRKQGMQQGLSRRLGKLQGEIIRSAFNNSYSDLQFLQRVNISESARNTNWRRLSALRRPVSLRPEQRKQSSLATAFG